MIEKKCPIHKRNIGYCHGCLEVYGNIRYIKALEEVLKEDAEIKESDKEYYGRKADGFLTNKGKRWLEQKLKDVKK
jgi:hypothetical protein